MEDQLRRAGGGTLYMSCGPKGSERRSDAVRNLRPPYRMFDLPGRVGRLCLSCGADQAISGQLTIEIDSATLSGQESESLIAEFAQLSQRLLERAQSA